MAIIGEMNGVPIDDLVYRQPKETGLSRMKVHTISCGVENVFDGKLEEFVNSNHCIYVNIVRYSRSKGYKAIILYTEHQNKKLQNLDTCLNGISRIKRYINRDDLGYDVGRIRNELNEIISDIEGDLKNE